MPENETPPTDPATPNKPCFGSVLVGHGVDSERDEAWVCLSINGQFARLSVAGARIITQQITAWADHAEARNKARPGDTMVKLMYWVMAKAAKTPAPAPEEPKKEWKVVDPERDAVMDEIDKNISVIAKVATRRKSAKRSVKKAKRK